jgi:hypothetical protein
MAKKLLVVVSVVVGLLLSAAPVSADVIAVRPLDGSPASDPNPFMIGYEFSTSAWIEVVGLGYIDLDTPGLGESHRVGIFDSGTGTLLVDAVVPSGTTAGLLDGFRTVPASLILTPGTYVIGGQQFSAADRVIVQATSLVEWPSVTYLEERELVTASFTMPTGNAAGNEKGIFGPSFVVSEAPIPEPATLSLLGLGLLAVARRRRRKH